MGCHIKKMGKYLGLNQCDTYEIYLIAHGKTEWEPMWKGYSKWIFEMKQIYGKEKNCPKHFYAFDYLIQDHQDFHKWIAEYHKEILTKNKSL
jgi:hypothetical protein